MNYKIIFALALVLTFGITVAVSKKLIPFLKSKKMGQKILDIGPRWHKSKEGTPTMGGFAFIIAAAVVGLAGSAYLALTDGLRSTLPFIMTLALGVAGGLIGCIDDSAKLRKAQNEGLTAGQKYLLQLIAAALYLIVMRLCGWLDTTLVIPYFGLELELGIFYYAVALLLITGMSVYWFAVSQAIDYFLIAIALLVIYRKLGGQKLRFSFKTAKSLFRVSRHYIISGMMVTIFAQTDKIMLKLMIDNEATGFYSTAVACATITGFVFVAIIDSVRPLIFESRKKSKEDFEKNLCRLYSAIIFLSLAQSVFMTLLAEPIIKILYGSAYLSSVDLLRLVVWFTTFSYMGSVRNIWILAEGKQKYLWMVNLMGASLNVILNALTIPYWGAMGAAAASLLTQFFTNVVTGIIIRPISYNNRLILRSLNPMLLWRTLKGALKNSKGDNA